MEWENEGSGVFTVRSSYVVLSMERAEYTIQPRERVSTEALVGHLDFFAWRAYFVDECVLCRDNGESS